MESGTSQILFNFSMALYLFASLGYLIYATSRNRTVSRLTTGIVIVGLVIHSVGLIYRWIETHRTGYGYVPLSNMYDPSSFFLGPSLSST